MLKFSIILLERKVMPNVILKCKNCGAEMQVNLTSKTITCMHCGTMHMLSEILDDKDLNFLSKNKPQDLGKKLEFNDAIKQGETYLFKAEYLKAEEAFKLAISIDEKNYKGYMGVVRAKTKNLNFLPKDDDYLSYAKIALGLAESDELVHLKNELEKLDVLKAENAKIKQEQNRQKDKNKHIEDSRRIKANFFSKLAYVITGIVAVSLLIGLIATSYLKNKNNKPVESMVEISSVEQFIEVTSNSSYLGSTIILKNDLDFGNKTISPIGENKFFTGSFRGNGFKIKNLTISPSNIYDDNYLGLFAKIDGAKISGLVLDNVKLIYENQNQNSPISTKLGLICGYGKNAEISNCAVLDTCIVGSKNTNSSISFGGIAGELDNSKISLSFSNLKSNIIEENNNKSTHFVGGLVGYLNNSYVTSCYSTSEISFDVNSTINSNIYIGGLAGYSLFNTTNSSITNSYFAGKINSGENANLNKDEHIAAITNYTSPVELNRIYSNFALFCDDNFVSENIAISKEELGDYTTDNLYVELVDSEENLILEIKDLFSANYWENLDTINPSQKAS